MRRLFLVLIVFISSFALMAKNVNAAGQLNIVSFPSSVIAGQDFQVSYSATSLDPSQSYYIKGLGGNGFTEVDTWNSQWLQQNAAWDLMPSFNSGSDGSPSGSIKVRFDTGAQSGNKDFKLRVAKSGSTDSNIDTSTVSISVTAATPTTSPTPAPTQAQQTTQPVYTTAPTSAPTSTPVPLKTKSPTPFPTPTPNPQVLGDQTQSSPSDISSLRNSLEATDTPTPSPAGKAGSSFPLIAGAFIFSGLGLMGFAGFMAYKKQKENSSDTINE